MVISILALIGAAAALAVSAPVAGEDVSYGYCRASEPDYGRYHVFTTVFEVPAGTYHVGVQNSFRAFAEAHDGRAFGSVSCSISYDSRQDAEDDKNEWMARHRRDGHDVRVARWAYRGD